MNGVESIAEERLRQFEDEGFSPFKDDQYTQRELAQAASCYAFDPRRYKLSAPFCWPLAKDLWKPTTYRQNLVKAGALIAAEIDRLDRIASER